MIAVNEQVTNSVIQQIIEGADVRSAIDSALDEKAGYHKEKRIRGGKATTVNVKNTKRKVHHALTAGQKKAIKKAHSAQANKKRVKSLKKGSKMGLYKEGINIVTEAEEEEAAGLVIACPACANANLDVFVDPDGEETDGTVLVCPECGETFVVVSTSELEDEDDDKDDDKDDVEEKAEDAAEAEVPQDESVETPAPVAEEAPVAESEDCGDAECDDAECDDANKACEPEEESGLYFAQE